MSKTCAFGPEFDKLVAEFDFGKATMIVDTLRDENGEITRYPDIEEAKGILEDILINDKDELFVRETEARKLERTNLQLENLYAERTKVVTVKKNTHQQETLNRLITMTERLYKIYSDNIDKIKEGKKIDKTIAVSSFIGASEFKGDPMLYLDYKNYGIFIHEIAQNAEILSKQKGINIYDIIDEEFVKQQREVFIEKNPFTIKNLSDKDVVDATKLLVSKISAFGVEGCIIMPEVTILGKTKNKNDLIGRVDMMVITPLGKVIIIDFKTKKVKDMVEYDNTGKPYMINDSLIFRNLTVNPYPIMMSRKDGTPIGVGESFKQSKLFKRTAFDNWVAQLDVYENILIQNGMEVTDKIVPALFYHVDEDGDYLAQYTYTFSAQDYYEQAFASYIKTNISEKDGTKTTYEEKITPYLDKMKAMREAVNKEVPISKEEETEKKKKSFIDNFEIVPEQVKAQKFINDLKSFVENQYGKIYQEISNEKEKPTKDDKYIDILKSRLENIKNLTNIIKKYEIDNTTDLARATTFFYIMDSVDHEIERLDKITSEINASFDNISLSDEDSDSKLNNIYNEIRKIIEYNKGLMPIIKQAEAIIYDFKDSLDKDSNIMQQIAKLRMASENIDGVYRKISIKNAISVFMSVGEVVYNRVGEQQKQYYVTKIAKLEQQIANLKEGKGFAVIAGLKHKVYSYLNKDYKLELEKYVGKEGSETLMRIDQLEKEIEKLNYLIDGVQFKPETFEKYINGITDPNSVVYFGSQNIYNSDALFKGIMGDDLIASVSNSELGLSAFVMLYKNAERNAWKSMQEDDYITNFDRIKQKLLKSGLYIPDINKKMSEQRIVKQTINDKEEQFNRLFIRKPYSVEYEDTYRGFHDSIKKYSLDMQKAKVKVFETTNELLKQKQGTPEYDAAKELNDTANNEYAEIVKQRETNLDNYMRWMQDNCSLPFTKEFYDAQMRLPVELREQIQKYYLEQETILYGVNKGFESMLEDGSLDRVFEIEIEINRLKKLYKDEHPEYTEAINKLNEFYEYDVKQDYFDRVEKNMKIFYKDNPEEFDKWRKLNTITRPRQEWYENLHDLYEKRSAIMPNLPDDIQEKVESLRRERSNIISQYKPFGVFSPKYLTDEDVERLDAIDNELDDTYTSIRELKLYSDLTKEERDELGEIDKMIKNLVTKRENERYKEQLYGDFEKLEQLNNKVLQAEQNYNAITNNENSTQKQIDEAFGSYTALLHMFNTQEEEYRIWYNKNHYDKFTQFESGNKKFLDYRQVKSFNLERVPADDMFMEEQPHPKYYSQKKLRKEIWVMDGNILSTDDINKLKALDTDVATTIRENRIIIKPSAYNEEYLKSPEGVPLPNSIMIDKNGHYIIKPGRESDTNINQKFIEVRNDSNLSEFYDAMTDLYFDLQKKIVGRKMGYEAPGFTEGAISNMLHYDNTSDAIKAQLQIMYDKSLNFKDSRYDDIANIYGKQGDKIQMRYSEQYPESMQSKDIVNCILKYSAEAHYNIELQKLAPKADLYIDYIKTLRDDLEKEVEKGKVKIITDEKSGKKINVDMSIRLKEINKIIDLMEYERRKFQYGQADIPLNKTAKKMMNTLMSYASFIRIGFDLANQTKNYLSGNVQAWLASGSFKSNHYSYKDYWWAKNMIYKREGFLWNYFSDWGNITNLHLSTLIYRSFDPMMKGTAKYMSEISGGKNLRLLQKATSINEMGFLFQDKGDTEIGITVMYSILNHYKYEKIQSINADGTKVFEKDKDGNTVMVSAHDCYFVNSKGLLEKRKDVNYSDADEKMLRNIVISEMRRAQGNYAKQDQTHFEEKALGKMVFFFRKFLVPQLLNRFSYMRPNYEGADVAYGYWRAFFGAIKYFGFGNTMGEFLLGHKVLNKMGIKGIEKITHTNKKTGISEEVKVGDFWNSKLQHARKDAFMMSALTILGYMTLAHIKQKSDDDEELSILEGNAIRILWGVTGETVAMNPVFGGQSDYIRNFTQGIPFVREFQYIQKLVTHGTSLAYVMTFTSGEEPDTNNDSLFYQRMYRDAFYAQQSGPYEQDSPKLIKDLVDMTGIRNLRDLLTPSNRLDVLKKNQ